MNFSQNVKCIFLVLFISGCAANIKEVVHNPINEDEKAHKETVFLDISHAKYISNSKDLTNSMNELGELISKKLTVVKNKSNSDLAVDISIENFKYVSGFGRFMAGVMVGDAELKLKVKVTELSSGNIIGESVFDTQSKFSEGIFGATTSRQLEAMAIKITEYINSSEKNS
ncbi:MAG: hypothetical protein GY923_10770 [Aestuariibacter sp.]|nr:hypothetical protein [Aestuariibacter sp.]